MRKYLAVILFTLMCALVANGQRTQPNRLPFPRPAASISSQPRPAATPYWDPNRKLNLNGPAKGDRRITTEQDFKFRINPVTRAVLLDALGRPLGTIKAGSQVKINKGAQRVIVGPNGERKVYELVLGARLDNPASPSPSPSPSYGSGFMLRTNIHPEDRLKFEPPKTTKVKGPTTARPITGGNPTDKSLGYFNQGKFVPYKFKDRKTGKGYTDSNRESTDYLARPLPGNKAYVNILSKLPGRGGTAASVIKIERKNPVNFHVLKNVPPKTIPLYKSGGKEKVGSMTFVKGYINDPKTHKKIVGWTAEKTLKPKPAPKKKKKS